MYITGKSCAKHLALYLKPAPQPYLLIINNLCTHPVSTMEIEGDLDTASRQDILNALQLHVLAPSFIDTVMDLIEDTSDSSSSSSSSSSDEEAISILSIMEIIQANSLYYASPTLITISW